MVEHDQAATVEDLGGTSDSTSDATPAATRNKPKLVAVERRPTMPPEPPFVERGTVYDKIPAGSTIKDSAGLRYIKQADGSLRRAVPKIKGGKKARRRIRPRGL